MLLNLLYNFIARAIEIGTSRMLGSLFSLFRGFLALRFLRNIGSGAIR
jgi:uncharacterized membrane protein required for colicin V production